MFETFVMVLFVVSAFVGAATIAFFVWTLKKEVIRAGRVAFKCATVCARLNQAESFSWATWWWFFQNEMMSFHDATIIGPYAVDYNPNRPIRRAFRYDGGRNV